MKDKADVVEMLAAHIGGGWRPRYEYTSMSMFAGELDASAVQFLLDDDRVAYVECDGHVKIARRGQRMGSQSEL